MKDKSNHGQVGDALYIRMTAETIYRITGIKCPKTDKDTLILEALKGCAVPFICVKETNSDYEVVCEDGIEYHDY
jgi:hypothetical protein